MAEIVQARHGDHSDFPHAVFHLTNPEVALWSSLVPPIQQKYSVETVEFGDWVAELKNIKTPTSQDVVDKPALKLLPFYKALADESTVAISVPLDVGRSQAMSNTMKSLEPVSAQLMSNWLEQWQF